MIRKKHAMCSRNNLQHVIGKPRSTVKTPDEKPYGIELALRSGLGVAKHCSGCSGALAVASTAPKSAQSWQTAVAW